MLYEKRIRRVNPKIFLFFFVFFVVSCQRPTSSILPSLDSGSSGLKLKNTVSVIARVNGVPLFMGDLEVKVEKIIPRFSGHRILSEDRMKAVWKTALIEMVEEELIFQEGKGLEISVQAKEINQEVYAIKNRFPSERAYEKKLKQEGLTEKKVREGVERFLLIQKTLLREVEAHVSIKERELERYYTEHREQFILPEQVRLRAILVGVKPSAEDVEWIEGYERALGLVERLNGGEDFSSLAREFSDDPQTRESGGDLGFVHKGQVKVQALEEEASQLGIGEVGAPIRTLFGYFIIRLEDRKPERQLTYSEINRDLLQSELRASAIVKRKAQWLLGLREKSEIEVFGLN